MRYEVVDVAAEQDGHGRTYLRVHAWHATTPENAPPDLVTEFLIATPTEVRSMPGENETGHRLTASGRWVSPWVEVDGEWMRTEDPPAGESWHVDVYDVDPLDVALAVVEQSVVELLRIGRKVDTYESVGEQLPRLSRAKNLKHPSSRVATVKGARRRVGEHRPKPPTKRGR
jgi:hypothetical protein